jgi:FtsP/CotA-like multicopper oxidase with cupredoxin domain
VVRLGVGRGLYRRMAAVGLAVLAASAAWLVANQSVGRATSSGDPYTAPSVVDTNPDPNVVETTLTSETATVDIGGGVMAHAETFNGSIPAPTFHLKVGDTVIVHFQNNLGVGMAIHWHGVEVPNTMDGTPFTQNFVQPGGSFLYKFKANRPGIFWYHPHHDPPNDSNTNQVFSGLYGMIIVTDPNEAPLQASGALPPPDQTKPIVLSDTTVCKAPGSNDAVTYPNPGNNTLPWVNNPNGGTTPPLPVQADPKPVQLCETQAVDGAGNARGPYAAGDIPAIQHNVSGRENEGQTVLTNGENVGGRAGSPAAPGALAPGASTLNVRPGQGLRLQLLDASAIRFFRLRLTDQSGTQIPLIRVGGEGGLLDSAVQEGGTQGTWITGYDPGEILVPPGSRADVVAAIPASEAAGTTLTLWTEDYSRTGMGFTDTPTVPVMHLSVTGTPLSPAYAISDGTPLRAATGDLVPVLGPPTGSLLDPATFSPAKLGNASPAISFTQTGGAGGTIGVNGTSASHDIPNYETAAHLTNSTRYAKVGDTLQLTVSNATGAHHPFHLHGFSIQPLSLSGGGQTFTWPYPEFRDNVDIPGGFTLTFRVKLEDRPQPDGTTAGGALGRWLFHCHIFFHATLGMLSELVVVPATSGRERPDINVNATQVQVSQGQTATLKGSYFDVDGEPVTLSSSVGTVHDDGGGNLTWSFPTGTASSQFVYLTATNADGSKAQIPFFLSIVNLGPPRLVLPGAKTVARGKTLTFGISATDPNPSLPVNLGASGLPAALKFKDNHNRTGAVSGKATARPGRYLATFTASDGVNPTTSGTVRITVVQPELTIRLARQLRVSKGAIPVGCVLLHPSLKSCKVTVFIGHKRVGSAIIRVRRHGKRTVSLKVKLNAQTLRRIAHSHRGVKVRIHLDVTKFGSRTVLRADAQATVLPAKKH